MSGFLKQSTASQTRTIGAFVDDTDFKTLENALTIANTDILLKKNGAASAAKNSGGATADGSGGMYHLTFDATDTGTVGELFYSVKVAGALVVFGSFTVLEEAVYDALYAASATGVPAAGALEATAQSILTDTAEIGAAGAGLTAINLPDQTMNITGDITGNLSGSVGSVTGAVGSVTGAVGSVTGNVGGNVTGSVGSLATQAKADVNAEVDTAIADARLDELLAADSDIDGLAPPTVGSVFHELLTKTAGSFTYDQTTDSLEAIRDKETDIETDTAEIGAAGAGLTNINLPNQTMDIVGNITGNLSGSVGSVTGAVGSVAAGGITAASIATGAIDADALAADAVDEILDELIGDSTVTMRQALKLMVAALGGKLSGAATTTVVIRNAADDTDRITATVDSNGNRSAVTLSL